jgi:hypothetical protein
MTFFGSLRFRHLRHLCPLAELPGANDETQRRHVLLILLRCVTFVSELILLPEFNPYCRKAALAPV